MAETSKKSPKLLRWYRNFNLGAAAVQLAGIAIFPEIAPVLGPLMALNIAQAGLAEVVRQQRVSSRKTVLGTT